MVEAARVRVLIVDDHAVVREGTRQLLERDASLHVVGEAGSGAEAIQLAGQLQPNVVLLDLALPDMNGVEVARRIREVAPATKVVVLSAYDDEGYVLAAMEVGVSAYLLKTVRGHEVVNAIHAAEQDQIVLHPTVAEKLRLSLRRGARENEDPCLSARELEILRLTAQGLHNKEIASTMSISVRTVEGHLSHILTKLGVTSRTEAVVYGAAHRWFTLT